MIRLSLIIPTHNRSERLIAALESVIRQDLPAADWECVVVSNNSTDDTVARFGDFAARYPGLNLRLVTEDGPGVSYARNRGIAETSAPLLVFIDDDERINPGFLRAYADFFDAHPDAVVAGGRIIAEYVTGRPAWLSKYTEMPIANPMDFGDAVRPFPAGRVPGGGNMAFRRSAALRYGGFDPSLGRVGRMLIGGEENDFFERLMRGGETCWYVPGAVMW
nr:glycosyltransferase family 2 protein [Alistipes sp.]